MSKKSMVIYQAVALIIIIFITYSNSLNNGYIWDDNRYVTQNSLLQNGDGLKKIWFNVGATVQYYPIVFTSFWIENKLYGLEPRGYHIDNIILHILNALLLWMVLEQLAIPYAWLCAAIFALHPMQVETVAWIAERKNLLSCFFYLLSVLCFFKFLPPNIPKEIAVPNLKKEKKQKKNTLDWRFYAFSLMFFISAMLSKTVAASLPVVFLIIYFWKRNKFDMSVLKCTIPFFVIGLMLGLVTVHLEKYNVLAMGKDWDFSFIDRILIAGRALCFYPAKLILPLQQIFIYPRWNIDPAQWRQYLFPAADLCVVAALILLRKKIGLAAIAAALFYIFTLAPALGFFNVYPMRYSFVADHFQYMAGIGIIAPIIAAIYYTSLRYTKHPKRIMTVFGAIIIIWLSMKSYSQTNVYKDQKALWQDTINKNDRAWIAYNNLGGVFAREGNYAEARKYYEECLILKPDHSGAMFNIGNIYAIEGNLQKAEDEYIKAIQMCTDNTIDEMYYQLAMLYVNEQKMDEALNTFNTAISKNPQNAKALNGLAGIYEELGRYQEALNTLNIYAKLYPNDMQVTERIQALNEIMERK
jgi:protein O-mannosyl-transferase